MPKQSVTALDIIEEKILEALNTAPGTHPRYLIDDLRHALAMVYAMRSGYFVEVEITKDEINHYIETTEGAGQSTSALDLLEKKIHGAIKDPAKLPPRLIATFHRALEEMHTMRSSPAEESTPREPSKGFVIIEGGGNSNRKPPGRLRKLRIVH